MLFKGDEWDIYEAKGDKYPHTGFLVVFAHHRNCQGIRKDKMNCWWLGDNKQQCILCDAKVPDNIQALMMLYTYGAETA